MKITTDRRALLSALSAVSPALPSSTTKPVLKCVKADASDGRLSLVATDMEVTARQVVAGVTVDRSGVTLLPAASLLKILGAATADTVGLACDDSGILVTAGRSKFNLPSWPVLEFPDPPEAADQAAYVVRAGDLTAALRRVQYAAAKKSDGSHFMLTSILFDGDGKSLTVVAADGMRLAVAPVPASEMPGEPVKCLVPPSTTAMLDRLLADDSEPVRIVLGGREAVFSSDRSTLHSRLVEGKYPPWRVHVAGVGKGCPTSIRLPTLDFLSKLREVAAVSDQESRRVNFLFAAGLLTMTVRKSTEGAGDVEMELPDYAGPDLAAELDATYLSQFLQAVSDEESVSLRIGDEKLPVMFEAGECRYIVARKVS